MEVVVVVVVATAVVVHVLWRMPRAEEIPVLLIPLRAPINHLSSLKHYYTGGWKTFLHF
jgi:hypothetical protein